MHDSVEYPTPPDPLAGRESEFGDELPPPELTDLPPVEPPSAGFIVQLFLVPALIVMVVIGVYLLFGKMASGEQDWRKQLVDLRSNNPHVRWRGALGLAQMLQSDATSDGVRLAENRDVATELSSLLASSLGRASAREDDLKQQEFLTRTLGLIDVPDVTFPVLVDAMDPNEDRETRKNAIAAVATAANRMNEQGRPLHQTNVVETIIAASEEPDSMIRHLATYALGMFDGAEAQERLLVLLEHADEKTRVNAAVALVRQGSTAGLPTFENVLRGGDPTVPTNRDSSTSSGTTDADDQRFEETLKLTNTMKALDELSDRLDADTKERLAMLVTPISREHADAGLQIQAKSLLTSLDSGE